MKIDRSNYEIWFTDWADNNLSKQQVEELASFLKANPDLDTEFREFSDLSVLQANGHFKSKDKLFKTPSDLNPDQFEYLCIARLEKDLSAIQEAELDEIIVNDPLKRKIHDSISRIKLTAPDVKWHGKKSLLRLTRVQKIIRVSSSSLGAAATIAAFILIFQLFKPEIKSNLAQINKDTLEIIIVNRITAHTPPVDEPVVVSSIKQEEGNKQLPELELPAGENPLPKEADYPVKLALTKPVVVPPVSESVLVKSEISFIAAAEDDGRSNVGKFISRTFREKILREKKISDAPLKGYEIAEAGIDGLNKLFGWEMAFTTNTDENGDVNAIHFRSKMLKFSAPVKKVESGE